MSRNQALENVPFIPFSRPTLGEEEVHEIVETVLSGWITSGSRVARFEEQFQTWLGVPAIAVTSGTAGMHLALHALGLKSGDEVITPAMTWPSTVNAIELTGGQPVFVDVDSGTLEMDVSDFERKITGRTRAVIPVHYAGQPCDMDRVREVIGRRDIRIIEDAAHAVGTTYRDRTIGSFGAMAIFSFHPIKNITTGEGGMIVCRDEGEAARLRRLRFHGISRDAWKRYGQGGIPQYDVEEPGYKYNMTDLQAALGIHQFGKLSKFNQRRTALALRYRELLKDIPEILPLKDVAYPAGHSWHLFVVRLDLPALKIDRDEFIRAMGEEKVGVGLHFLAAHLQSHYRRKYGYQRGHLPNTEAAGDSIFSLPLYPLLKETEQDRVVEVLARLVQKYRR